MRVKTIVAVVFAVAVLSLSGTAWAQSIEPAVPPIVIPEPAAEENGQEPRVFARKFTLPPMEYPLHTQTAKAGPVSTVTPGMAPTTGSAIVAPSGGSFVTPRMKADRAIRRVIERLD